LLEEKIKEQLKTDPKFAFLNDEDPYHKYYKFTIEKVREDAEDIAKGIMAPPQPEGSKDKGKEKEAEAVSNAYEPKAWEFKVDLPGVTAQDL
jgi:splicing factor 3A subunit 1